MYIINKNKTQSAENNAKKIIEDAESEAKKIKKSNLVRSAVL